MIKFEEFSKQLFKLFKELNLEYSVLWNYEGLPNCKVGEDIDILLSKSDVDKVIWAIKSIDDNIVSLSRSVDPDASKTSDSPGDTVLCASPLKTT